MGCLHRKRIDNHRGLVQGIQTQTRQDTSFLGTCSQSILGSIGHRRGWMPLPVASSGNRQSSRNHMGQRRRSWAKVPVADSRGPVAWHRRPRPPGPSVHLHVAAGRSRILQDSLEGQSLSHPEQLLRSHSWIDCELCNPIRTVPLQNQGPVQVQSHS